MYVYTLIIYFRNFFMEKLKKLSKKLITFLFSHKKFLKIVVLQWIQWIILIEEVRGARKEVDLWFHLEGSPPKLDSEQGRNQSEEILSSCHDDLYGRAVLLMHSCWEWRRSFYQYCVAPRNPLFLAGGNFFLFFSANLILVSIEIIPEWCFLIFWIFLLFFFWNFLARVR